jgi:hypothetical protein
MLVGALEVGLSIHIHQWFSVHWQFLLLGRQTQEMPTSSIGISFLMWHFDPTPFDVIFH